MVCASPTGSDSNMCNLCAKPGDNVEDEDKSQITVKAFHGDPNNGHRFELPDEVDADSLCSNCKQTSEGEWTCLGHVHYTH